MDAPAAATVAAVLQVLELVPDQVAVELDGAVVPRRSWSGVRVSPGSALEIVRFVGGG